MTDIIKRSFGLNIRLMKLCGLYPSNQSPILVKARTWAMYCCFLLLNTSLMLVKLFSMNNTDVLQLVFSGAYSAETLGYCFKIFPFLTNGHRIEKCINRFAASEFAPMNQDEKRILESCVRICRRNSSLYFYGITATAILVFSAKLFQYKLPVDLWLPYDPLSGPVKFYATFFYILAGTIYYFFAGSMADPLIASLSYHATTQIQILKYRLENFDKFTILGDGVSLYQFLKKCVDHHNSILEFIAEYQACFSLSIFSQFAGSTFALCFCCLGIIMDSGASSDSAISSTCFICILFQIFFYCYYGTLLFEENLGLNDAMYMGPWYQCNTKVRKALFIMMERSKIPVILTAGKVVNVTLQTFVSVLKTSYSLIAIVSIAFNKYS